MNVSPQRFADTPGYPADLAHAEYAYFHPEREQLIDPATVQNWPGSADDRSSVGVGLSGGGVRSATFCLGVFQALAQRKLIRRIGYLSTVSGGGYFGGLLSGMFARGHNCDYVEKDLADPQSPLLGWMRENGRYLAPRGSGDMLFALAIVLRGWISVLLLMTMSTIALFGLMQLLRWSVLGFVSTHDSSWVPLLATGNSADPNYLSPALYLALAVFVCITVPSGAIYWSLPRSIHSRVWIGKILWRALIVLLLPALALTMILLSVFGERAWHSGDTLRSSGLVLLALLTLTFGQFVARLRESMASTPRRGKVITLLTLGFATMLGIALGLLFDAFPNWVEHFMRTYLRAAPTWISLTTAMLVVLCVVGAWLLMLAPYAQAEKRISDEDRADVEPFDGLILRHWLSDRYANFLELSVAIAVLGIVDTLAAWVYAHTGDLSATMMNSVGLLGVLATLAANAKRAAQWLGYPPSKARMPLPLDLLAALIAGALLLVLLVGADTIAIAASFGFKPGIDTWPLGYGQLNWISLTALTLACLLLAAIYGKYFPEFVNNSSYHNLYKNRLVRAYLGASNPERQSDLLAGAVSAPVLNDDIDFDPATVEALRRSGAPLHIVNLTLNETISPLSNLQQQDRKGNNLATSPVAITAPICSDDEKVTNLLQLRRDIRCMPQPLLQPMSLGVRVSISGAAFSTGMGFQTSVGLSLLMGILNLRTGFWWNSGTKASKLLPMGRGACSTHLPVQTQLVDEWTARYFGTLQQYWNLSDGGHFENLAAYELIRRKLARIVIVDAGADGAYNFGDVANLIRKARSDFDAEIQFLDPPKSPQPDDDFSRALTAFAIADPSAVGSLEELRRSSDHVQAWSARHAALARIDYSNGTSGWLLYIKPTVTASAPADVIEYQRLHPDFPHETTADQFFDEAQWESYRKLGQSIAARLFGVESLR